MSTPSVLRPPGDNRSSLKLSPRFASGASSQYSIPSSKMTCSTVPSTSNSLKNSHGYSKNSHKRCSTFGASDSEILKKKYKNKTRFRTTNPYEFDDKVKVRKWSLDTGAKNHPDDPQSSVRLSALPQIRAPDNTTQFLMEDFEQREIERPCLIMPRTRCYSVCSGVFGTPPVVEVDAESDSELSYEGGNDNEFEQELDSVKMESIEEMSRDQVNQSMLEAEKSNLHLLSRIDHLRAENIRLKRLLKQNGIEYKSDSHSERTSSTNSDTSNISNFDEQHEILPQDAGQPDVEEEAPGLALHPTPPTNYD